MKPHRTTSKSSCLSFESSHLSFKSSSISFRGCNISFLLLLLFVLISFTSCHYRQDRDAWKPNDEVMIDSVEFRRVHHYWKGYNFCSADTFSVASRPAFAPTLIYTRDSMSHIEEERIIAVQDIRRDTTANGEGAVWLKIVVGAKEGFGAAERPKKPTVGWIREADFIKCVVPDTPVSKIIHILGNECFRIVLFCIAAAVMCVVALTLWRRWRARRALLARVSPYVLLFNFVLCGALVLHRSIWHYAPETWEEYYFYPSLNPFTPHLPPVIAAFVFSLWMLLIAALAAVNAHRRTTTTFGEWCKAVLHMFVTGFVLFGFFAVVVPFSLLYVAMLAYWGFVLMRYWRHSRGRMPYICGNCGRSLRALGPCPHCGALNE